MKRIILCLVISILTLPCSLFAVEKNKDDSKKSVHFSFGANVMYAWWEPMFKDNILDPQRFFLDSSTFKLRQKTDISQAFLYGPMVSLTVNEKWRISSIFITSQQFNFEDLTSRQTSQNNHTLTSKSITDIRRYDTDTALSYIINRYLYLFAGYKFQQYRYRGDGDIFSTSPAYMYEKHKAKNNAHGAGLGFGVTVPLIDYFFLSCSFSGLYQRSKITGSGQFAMTTPVSPYLTINDLSLTGNIYGANSNLAFGYFIKKASLTVSLGARYQFYRYIVHNTTFKGLNNSYLFSGSLGGLFLENSSANYILKNSYNMNYDHFYGITFSVICTL